MLIHRNVIRALAPALATADSRHVAMAGIYIDPDGPCVATNGHILIRAESASGDDAADYPAQVNGDQPIDATLPATGPIDGAALVAAAKATPRRAATPGGVYPILENVVIVQGDAHTEIVTTDLERVNRTGATEIDSQFPAWHSIYDQNARPAGANAVTISAELLASLATIAKSQRPGKTSNASVTFHIVPDQKTNAVYFEVEPSGDSPAIDGLVMPMRRK